MGGRVTNMRFSDSSGLHRPDALPDANDANGSTRSGATLHALGRSHWSNSSSGDEGAWDMMGLPQDVKIDMRRCIKTIQERCLLQVGHEPTLLLWINASSISIVMTKR